MGQLTWHTNPRDAADGAGERAQKGVSGGGADGLETDTEESVVALGRELRKKMVEGLGSGSGKKRQVRERFGLGRGLGRKGFYGVGRRARSRRERGGCHT